MDLRRLVNGLRTAGELSPKVADALEVVERAAQLYGNLHGGHNGWNRPPINLEVPHIQPGEVLVEMGALARISYLTSKEPGRKKPDEFGHNFDTPRPVLYVHPASGDLVIVRNRSSYTVNSRGIVG
jgi:hypothetical protein